jgi:hypothetical protein
MKRLSLRSGESWLYDGTLDTGDELVRFVDIAGHGHEVRRADVTAVALESGGAHPDDEEVVQLLN